MNIFTKLNLLQHIIRWRLTWNKRDTAYKLQVPDNPKFMSARDAVQKIRDGSVIATSGLAGNQRASILYWAIRELFEETGHPANLTIICTGGQGARGKAPGTLEELGHKEGLCTRMIAGHLETFKSLLRLADAGKLEIHCLPQGIISFLFEQQTLGNHSLLTETGIGTFVDPKSGRGSLLIPTGRTEVPGIAPAERATIPAPGRSDILEIVRWEGDKLRYEIPKVQVALFNAPAADREGNIYVKNCVITAESYNIAKAARKNGGIVIANVGLLVEKGYDEIFLPAEDVDAVVVYPDTEQTASVPHRKHWSFFTTRSKLPVEEGIARVGFINHVFGITPRRNEISEITARLAARIFTRQTHKGDLVNIGTGLPEEVCRILLEHGLWNQIVLFTEAGVLGGVPAPGVFFGAAVCPEKILSSAEMFKRCYEKLDVAILGVLQADSHGNVNVSKRGEGIINYVGPGGFVDLSTNARTIVFVSSWMAHGKIVRQGEKVRIVKMGKPKFVDKVDEITFNGPRAVQTGKKVFYVTDVGVFQLTGRGMEQILIMPGIDVQKDILEFSPMKVILPESGNPLVVEPSVVTGKQFELHFNDACVKTSK